MRVSLATPKSTSSTTHQQPANHNSTFTDQTINEVQPIRSIKIGTIMVPISLTVAQPAMRHPTFINWKKEKDERVHSRDGSSLKGHSNSAQHYEGKAPSKDKAGDQTKCPSNSQPRFLKPPKATLEWQKVTLKKEHKKTETFSATQQKNSLLPASTVYGSVMSVNIIKNK
jgi:hypothetical protein